MTAQRHRRSPEGPNLNKVRSAYMRKQAKCSPNAETKNAQLCFGGFKPLRVCTQPADPAAFAKGPSMGQKSQPANPRNEMPSTTKVQCHSRLNCHG